MLHADLRLTPSLATARTRTQSSFDQDGKGTCTWNRTLALTPDAPSKTPSQTSKRPLKASMSRPATSTTVRARLTCLRTEATKTAMAAR